MRTQYYTATSLNGFIATVDHSLEWLFQLGDVNETSYPRFIQDVGALAMGSSTYEWMLRRKQWCQEPLLELTVWNFGSQWFPTPLFTPRQEKIPGTL